MPWPRSTLSCATRFASTRLAIRARIGIRLGRGVAQPGRALGSGPRGRWFKSTRPDHIPLFFYSSISVVMNAELVRAIHEKRLIELVYNNARRIVEPHDYGMRGGTE